MKRMQSLLVALLIVGQGFGQVISDNGAICKAYAIACAQLSNQSYTFSKLAYFVHKDQLAARDVDSAVIRIRQSIVAIDSAITLADPACILALNYAQIARRYAVGAYKTLKLYQQATSRKKKETLAEQATLLAAKATVDAYHASFYFFDGQDTIETAEPETEKKDSVPAARVITKLDIDQALFTLLDEQLQQKLAEDQKKLEKLQKDLKNAKDPAKKAKIKAEIKKLEAKNSELATKDKNARERLEQINTKLDERKKNPGAAAEEQNVFSKSRVTDQWNKQVLTNAEMPMGLIYQVQIGIYKSSIMPDIFKGLTPIFATTVPQGIMYSTGMFEMIADAQQARDYVQSIGLTDAFVVAYYNQKKISTAEALKLEKK